MRGGVREHGRHGQPAFSTPLLHTTCKLRFFLVNGNHWSSWSKRRGSWLAFLVYSEDTTWCKCNLHARREVAWFTLSHTYELVVVREAVRPCLKYTLWCDYKSPNKFYLFIICLFFLTSLMIGSSSTIQPIGSSSNIRPTQD
jgi:hypothetical protein